MAGRRHGLGDVEDGRLCGCVERGMLLLDRGMDLMGELEGGCIVLFIYLF